METTDNVAFSGALDGSQAQQEEIESDDEESVDVLPKSDEWSTRLERIKLEVADLCKLTRDRRSEDRNGLQYEQFSKNNKNNYATFRTDRPMQWFLALQKYVTKHRLTTRCEIKKQKKINKVSILKIHAVFKETKKVFLSLNFNTGVFSVKEKNYKEWVSDEFDLVKEHMEAPSSSSLTETTELVIESEKETPRDVVGENRERQENGNEKNGELKGELASIWSTMDGFKNAISSLETGLLKVTERMDNFEGLLKDYTTSQNNCRKTMEKNFDGKISLYEETSSKNITNNIQKLKTDLSNKIIGVKSLFTKFKEDVETKVETLTLPVTQRENELHEKINLLEERKVDVSKFEKDLNKLDDHYTDQMTERKSEVSNFEKELCTFDEKHTNGLAILKSQFVERDVNVTSNLQKMDNLTQHIQKQLNAYIELSQHSIHTTLSDDKVLSNDTTVEANEITVEANNTTIESNNTTIEANSELKRRPSATEFHKDNETVLIMCMDSNSKYLDRRKLWDLQGTEFKRCGVLEEVEEHIDRKILFSKLQYFFMSVGCNDIDSKDGQEVFGEMRNIVLNIKHLYPNVKVIVSEITPRMDDRDQEVKNANRLLNEFVKGQQDVYITRNGICERKISSILGTANTSGKNALQGLLQTSNSH